MDEIITCSNCGKSLSLPDSLRGQAVECPLCKTQFVVGASSQVKPPPLPSPSSPSMPMGSAPSRPDEHGSASWPEPNLRRRDEEGDDWDSDFDRRRRSVRRDFEPHRGALILTLGIVSIGCAVVGFFCPLTAIPGVIVGPIAWVLGSKDLTAIQENRKDPDGRGLTQAGWICGIVGTILNGCAVILGLFFLILYGAMFAAAARGK